MLVSNVFRSNEKPLKTGRGLPDESGVGASLVTQLCTGQIRAGRDCGLTGSNGNKAWGDEGPK